MFSFVLSVLCLSLTVAPEDGCHAALQFGVKTKENQDKVPTLHWLHKLHKNL